MSDPKKPEERQEAEEPKGLGEHAMGPAAEAAHELGWNLNEEERTTKPKGRPAYYGGKGYDYGAQDFGDTPANDNPEGVSDDSEDQRKAS